MKNKDSTSTIDIDAEWVRKVENKAYYEAKSLRDQNSTICKVSEILRNVQPEAYEPVIVSLGPYHHHKPHLQAMNQLKWALLYKLLEKGSENSLRNYLILIKEKEAKVRNSYSELPINMCEKKKFIEMMMRDCVFVIMILWFWKSKEGLEAIEDSIFRSGQRTLTLLARDMLLLENQLPFFLLEALFDKAFPDKSGQLKPWISQFFSGFVEDKELQVPEDAKQVHHILHLFYLCINVPLNRSSSNVVARQKVQFEDSSTVRVPSATRLMEVRRRILEIKRKEKAKSFLDITFEKGVLEIPQIEIDDDTNILFRNLIAFEQCQKSAAIGYDISTYAWFLSCIAATVNDVELLQESGIIIDRLGNQRKVARLLGKLCEGVLVDHKNCYVSRVFKEVVAKDREIPYRSGSWLELAISRRYQIREPQIRVDNFNQVAKDRQIRYVNLRSELVRQRVISMKSR